MKNNHHIDITNLVIVRATKRVFKEFNIAADKDDDKAFCVVLNALISIEDRLADKIRNMKIGNMG